MSAVTRMDRMKSVLEQIDNVVHVDVLDESMNHAAGRKATTHLRVLVVSPLFEAMSQVARHRWVNALFKSEFDSGLHALAVTARTPSEWEATKAVGISPPCAGVGKQ